MIKTFKTFLFLLILFSTNVKCNDEMSKLNQRLLLEMSFEQKISQLLIVGVYGKNNNDINQELIKKYKPGGIILFGYNISSKNKLKKFIDSLQDYSIKVGSIPMFISIDQEGGRVKRIIDGVTQFPGNMAMGVVNKPELTKKAAEILALQLRYLGINMNLTPDVDVNNNPGNPVINTRSFGSNADLVAIQGVNYIKGLQGKGVIAVAKHFPGHGDTNKDSHKTLPEINYTLERLEKIEFVPFRKIIENGVEAIMSAHISYPLILKNNRAATLSSKFMTEILQEKLGFSGLIMTDDMEMNAISKEINIGEAAVLSILAGVDSILISTHGDNVGVIYEALKKAYMDGRITEERLNKSVLKILKLKSKYAIYSISEKDGKKNIIYPRIANNEIENEILQSGDSINQTLSDEALYLYNIGKNDNIKISPNSYVLADNSIFISELKKNNKVKILKNKRTLFRIISKGFNVKDNMKIFIYAYNHDFNFIKKIQSLEKNKNFKLYLLCSGNPFLFNDIKPCPPVLFSFSNTEKSIISLVKALEGKIEPKREIPMSLGFN